MADYLSAEWFDQVGAGLVGLGTPSKGVPSQGARSKGDGVPDVVLRQVVTGAPGGDVTYQVEIRAGHASLTTGASGEADMTFTSDYRTAAAIASGSLSTQVALLEGRIRVSGNPEALASHEAAFGHLDPVPVEVRRETTYPS